MIGNQNDDSEYVNFDVLEEEERNGENAQPETVKAGYFKKQ